MYVLMDMEWVENKNGGRWPTQLAAMRVNENWETVDLFSALIHPIDISFQLWDHMAFSGRNQEDFEKADDLGSVLNGFKIWLKSDDILCWWHGEARDFYNLLISNMQGRDIAQKSIILREYIFGYLSGGGGSPYKICATLGIAVPMPAHCSENDVHAMQNLLISADFPQQSLLQPPPKPTGGMTALKGTGSFPLLYDPGTGFLHLSDCANLPEQRYLPAFTSFQAPIRHKYKPCDCCRKGYQTAIRERNQSFAARTDCNYIFSPNSKVFHRKDCPYVLSSLDIQGVGLYKTCIKSGRRPCKHCNPVPVKPSSISQNERAEKSQHTERGKLTKEEQDALLRFQKAKKERETALKHDMTEAEREAMMVLTQPGYAFWAGKGYRTFHRRSCPLLAGLRPLRGFRKYEDAVHFGYSPCRRCKPNAKQDVVFSIPITSEERVGETSDTLVRLCKDHGISFWHDERYFVMETMVGRWKIDASTRPVRLAHINLVREPENTEDYHVQPRLFLSLRDTFDYILRHDYALIKEAGVE